MKLGRTGWVGASLLQDFNDKVRFLLLERYEVKKFDKRESQSL